MPSVITSCSSARMFKSPWFEFAGSGVQSGKPGLVGNRQTQQKGKKHSPSDGKCSLTPRSEFTAAHHQKKHRRLNQSRAAESPSDWEIHKR